MFIFQPQTQSFAETFECEKQKQKEKEEITGATSPVFPASSLPAAWFWFLVSDYGLQVAGLQACRWLLVGGCWVNETGQIVSVKQEVGHGARGGMTGVGKWN